MRIRFRGGHTGGFFIHPDDRQVMVFSENYIFAGADTSCHASELRFSGQLRIAAEPQFRLPLEARALEPGLYTIKAIGPDGRIVFRSTIDTR